MKTSFIIVIIMTGVYSFLTKHQTSFEEVSNINKLFDSTNRIGVLTSWVVCPDITSLLLSSITIIFTEKTFRTVDTRTIEFLSVFLAGVICQQLVAHFLGLKVYGITSGVASISAYLLNIPIPNKAEAIISIRNHLLLVLIPFLLLCNYPLWILSTSLCGVGIAMLNKQLAHSLLSNLGDPTLLLEYQHSYEPWWKRINNYSRKGEKI